MPAALPSSAIRSTIRSREFPSLFSPRLTASARRLLPSGLYRRLDPFEATIESFVRSVAAEIPAGKRVLDAGAGESRFKSLFAHTEYVGIDFAQGDKSWDYSKLDVIGKLEELPFPDLSFDHILSIVVLEHTPQPGRVIEEFQRILKPGGMVHLVVPHMWEEHQKPHDFFRFTSGGIWYLLHAAGIRIRRIHRIGGFLWRLGWRLCGVLSFTQCSWGCYLFALMAFFFGRVP